MKQLLHDLAGRVSMQQMNIVRMKGCGYGIREIASREKLPMKRIKELLEESARCFWSCAMSKCLPPLAGQCQK